MSLCALIVVRRIVVCVSNRHTISYFCHFHINVSVDDKNMSNFIIGKASRNRKQDIIVVYVWHTYRERDEYIRTYMRLRNKNNIIIIEFEELWFTNNAEVHHNLFHTQTIPDRSDDRSGNDGIRSISWYVPISKSDRRYVRVSPRKLAERVFGVMIPPPAVPFPPNDDICVVPFVDTWPPPVNRIFLFWC